MPSRPQSDDWGLFVSLPTPPSAPGNSAGGFFMSGGSLSPIEALAVGSAAPAVSWPLYFFGAFTVVTVVALCRAKRDDVPKIFAAFASAFGFRGLPRPGASKRGRTIRDDLPASGAKERLSLSTEEQA